MWVEELRVGGFMRLAGTYEFGSGLTVVTGDNEAGKSSLHDLIVRSLWGFAKSERRRSRGVTAAQACRPWDGPVWRSTAIVRTDDDRRLRVEWDFDSHTVRMYDAVTGDDLSAQVAGDGALGEFLVGGTHDDFLSVCCLGQEALGAVRRTDTLVSAMQRAVETTAVEVGLASAEERLCAFLKDVVGVRRDSYGPLPTGPQKRDLDRRDALLLALDEGQAARDAVAELARDLDKHALRRTVFVAEQRALEQGILHAEAEEARKHLAEAERQAAVAGVAAEPDPAAGPDVEDAAAARIRERIGEVLATDRAVAELARAAADAAAEADVLRPQLAAVEADLAQLEPYAAVALGAAADVRRLVTQLDAVEAQSLPADPVAPVPDPRVARYRSRRTELIELAGAPETTAWKGLYLGAAAVLGVASIIGTLLVTPLLVAGLVVAVAVAAAGRPRPVGEPFGERLTREFGVARLEDLEVLLRDEDAAVARHAAQVAATAAARDEHAARAGAARAALGQALEGVGAVWSGDLRADAATYLENCERHAAYEERRLEHARVEARLAELAGVERDSLARRGKRDALRAELDAALAAVAIDATDLVKARAELDARVAATQARTRHHAQATGAAEALAALLGDRTLDDLRQDCARCDAALDAHRRRHDVLEIKRRDLPALRSELHGVESTIAQTGRHIAGLEAQIAERERDLVSPAEIREEIAAIEERVAERELAAEAIRIARDALAAAAQTAHREFAPHLQDALADTLPRLTRGRYREVMVADDLSVSVIAPEHGGRVDADCLSRGTQDQIYLAQRLAIARLLMPGGTSAPLLLDEPFAEFDEPRTEAGIQLLLETAEDRQVVVFTKDRELAERCLAVNSSTRTFELSAPLTAEAVL